MYLWCCLLSLCFFFFKQKTAYEMRISDWSSDVCSSDLLMMGAGAAAVAIAWALAPWGVALLFERGAFTADNTQAVAQVLRWGLLQLPFYFGVLILVQLLASQNRYRVMALIAVANFLLKVVLNAILAPQMGRSEEHTSELQSLMRHSYANFCLKKK